MGSRADLSVNYDSHHPRDFEKLSLLPGFAQSHLSGALEGALTDSRQLPAEFHVRRGSPGEAGRRPDPRTVTITIRPRGELETWPATGRSATGREASIPPAGEGQVRGQGPCQPALPQRLSGPD